MFPKILLRCLVLLVIFTVLAGIIYPVLVTGVAQLAFPYQANGSLIFHNGEVVGSELIGQAFDDPAYFWGRPSSTSPYPYNANASSGSNLGQSSKDLYEIIATRVDDLHQSDPANPLPIPVDLVTASASGLDPHISPEAARYQIHRIAIARNLNETALSQLVDDHIQMPLLGFWGESSVNVLELNLSLDKLSQIE